MSTTRLVYFAYCDATGLVKIGITVNVVQRMNYLRSQCGHRVRLLSYRHGSFEEETQLKKRFAAYHVGHEWFRVDGELFEYLQTKYWGKKIPRYDESRKALIVAQNKRYADMYCMISARIDVNLLARVQAFIDSTRESYTLATIVRLGIDLALEEIRKKHKAQK